MAGCIEGGRFIRRLSKRVLSLLGSLLMAATSLRDVASSLAVSPECCLLPIGLATWSSGISGLRTDCCRHSGRTETRFMRQPASILTLLL